MFRITRRAYSSGRNNSWHLTPELESKIAHYAQFPATGVSLRQMVQFGGCPSDGTLFRASQFIVEELPIRIAHRVKELESLPYGLNKMPSIIRVKDWYSQSFEELTSIPTPSLSADIKRLLYHPRSKQKISVPVQLNHQRLRTDLGIKGEESSSSQQMKAAGQNSISSSPSGRQYFSEVETNVQWPVEVQGYNRQVTKILQKIKARHDGVITTVAQGVVEWKNSSKLAADTADIQDFLDRFYMSRIGIRMLIGQHIALNMDRGIREDYVGIICTDTNVAEVAQAAINNARFICEDWYGLFEAPKVDLHQTAENINFMYVPGHLSHMIFEIVKNSLRAVVETHGLDHEEFPPVKVIIAQGDEDITIKISDEGGGIPRRAVDKVWTYMYTTADEIPELGPDIARSDFKAPLAGFGYGLPVSRLYARYFGGDLVLIPMEGYGTDVYLHLNRLSTAAEPLE